MTAAVYSEPVCVETLAAWTFGQSTAAAGRRWTEVDDDTQSQWRDRVMVGLRLATEYGQ